MKIIDFHVIFVKKLFYKKMCFGRDGRQWEVFCKSTVDSLIARGYPINPNDLIIVDEEQEPALQRIIQSKRGSNRKKLMNKAMWSVWEWRADAIQKRSGVGP